MHLRVRYRLSFAPFAIVGACIAAVIAMSVGPLGGILAAASPQLPRALTAACVLVPLAFVGWYSFSFVELRGGRLTVRSLLHASRLELRDLAKVEVYAREQGTVARLLTGGFARREHDLLVRLEDEHGGRVLLPLNSWRDEELLMARVLRATVDRRVRIQGEPLVVRRFTGLLDSYKSWERRQRRAA